MNPRIFKELQLAYKLNYEVTFIGFKLGNWSDTGDELIKNKYPTVKFILLTDPLSYFEFLKLISDARLVITDSDGVQEETSFLNIPCVTFRKNTERPVTVQLGTNILMNI